MAETEFETWLRETIASTGYPGAETRQSGQHDICVWGSYNVVEMAELVQARMGSTRDPDEVADLLLGAIGGPDLNRGV